MTTSHYQAARENLFGHVPFLQRRMPGMLIRDLGGALLVDSGLGSDTFNKVLWECGGDGRPCRVERGAEAVSYTHLGDGQRDGRDLPWFEAREEKTGSGQCRTESGALHQEEARRLRVPDSQIFLNGDKQRRQRGACLLYTSSGICSAR